MPDTCKQGHPWSPENTGTGSKGQRVCLLCMRQGKAKWKKKNPDKVLEEQRRRRAADPEFRNQSRADARLWRQNNLEAALENAQRWRKENPERVRDNYRKWRKDNPQSGRRRDNLRRARKVQAAICGPVPLSIYASVISSGPCVYCAKPATEVDHVRPLSRGGIEHLTNLVPACKSCNSSKKDRMLDQWDPVRVAQAVKVSSLVRAEWDRIKLGQEILF